MVRIPPRLPPPGRPQRNFRIPPPPLIKSPASGLAINALCNSLYASSGRSVVICFVNVGASMKSMNDYTPLGDSCKEFPHRDSFLVREPLRILSRRRRAPWELLRDLLCRFHG